MIRALKEKAPFWAEKLPELPELFYDSLQQHKLLQQSVDKLTGQMQAQRVRQGQSRYLGLWLALRNVIKDLPLRRRRCFLPG